MAGRDERAHHGVAHRHEPEETIPRPGDADRALKFIQKNDLFDNRVYNVLTDNVIVGHIVDILQKYISDVAVKLVDNQIRNQLCYEVACERFEAKGFRSQGKMEEGIKATLDLHRSVRN